MNGHDDINVWLDQKQFSDDMKKCLIGQMHLFSVYELRFFSWTQFSFTPGYRVISNEEKERFRQVLREDGFLSRGWARLDDDNQAGIAPYHTFAEHRSRVFIRTPSLAQEEPRFSWRSSILRFLLNEFSDRNEVPANPEPPAAPAMPQSPYILRDDLDRDRDLNWEAVQRVAADADCRSFRLSESFLAGVNSGRQGGGRAGRTGGLL